MVLYICENCNKKFTHKSNYMRHLDRINKCTKKDLNNNNTENKVIEKLEAKLDEKDKLILSIIEEKDKLIMSLIEKLMTNNTTPISNKISKSNLNTNSNTNSNNINNTNSNNNTYNYVLANYKDALNIEDCFNKNKITNEMIEECSNMYYPDGAKYIIKKLCDIGEEKRPLHCADASRRNYVVKTENKWIKDIKCSKLKDSILPVIDNVYRDIYKKEHKRTNDDFAYVNNQCSLLIESEHQRFNKMIDETSTLFTLKNKK